MGRTTTAGRCDEAATYAARGDALQHGRRSADQDLRDRLSSIGQTIATGFVANNRARQDALNQFRQEQQVAEDRAAPAVVPAPVATPDSSVRSD